MHINSCDFRMETKSLRIFISPPVFSRQALSYAAVTFFPVLFNDRLEQRELGNCKTDLHQIFTDGGHVGVDVQSGIGLPTGQGTLPWQRILSTKSAEIGDTPSSLRLAFNNGWQEPLNGFAPNSQGRRVWSFARRNLNAMVKGQRSMSPGTKTRCALTTPPRCGRNVIPSFYLTSGKQQAQRFDRSRGVYSLGCVRCAWQANIGLRHAFIV